METCYPCSLRGQKYGSTPTCQPGLQIVPRALASAEVWAPLVCGPCRLRASGSQAAALQLCFRAMAVLAKWDRERGRDRERDRERRRGEGEGEGEGDAYAITREQHVCHNAETRPASISSMRCARYDRISFAAFRVTALASGLRFGAYQRQW